jgi:NADH-quinone oxidoreductase subunit I
MVGSLIKRIWALLVGLKETLTYFIKSTILGKPITQMYPEERRTPYPRFHGLHRLLRDEGGGEKCVACGLCAAVCPARCIIVEAAENERNVKYARHYQIDISRCIFCGYCVDACPVGALLLSGDYELADYTRGGMIYTKERLLRE